MTQSAMREQSHIKESKMVDDCPSDNGDIKTILYNRFALELRFKFGKLTELK
jgi:hypothetical protein